MQKVLRIKIKISCVSESFKIDIPYLPEGNGCRLIWSDGDEERVVYLTQEEFEELNETLSKNSTAKIELEDQVSSILVNSDITEFFIAHRKSLQINTKLLQDKVKEFVSNHPKV